MSPIETMSPEQLRERYLQSLSPIERMDYELACAREKRLIAERREEEALLVRELDDFVEAARDFKDVHLSRLAVRRIVQRLYGAEALQPESPHRPQPKGRVERVNRQIARGDAA
ncbi:MAG: hypothetical protein LCH80_05505 [Proteobacteria bacterium]|nr:hypothetical protein [Pseudomonadota bacterium]